MILWDIKEIKDICISIGAVAGALSLAYTLIRDLFLKKPRLLFKAEEANLIEDFPGELGIQINVEIKACNSSFFLKNIELKHKEDKVNEKLTIEKDVREHIKEDVILKYLEEQRKKTTSAEKENRKIEELSYYLNYISGESGYRLDSLGNSVMPDIKSDFQKSFVGLTRKLIYEESRYQQPQKFSSLHDLKMDDQSIQSFSLFFHVYGELDPSFGKRARLPLENWKIILTHSEGKISRNLKTKNTSYLKVRNFIDGDKED
jgi:hypothetical protein